MVQRPQQFVLIPHGQFLESVASSGVSDAHSLREVHNARRRVRRKYFENSRDLETLLIEKYCFMNREYIRWAGVKDPLSRDQQRSVVPAAWLPWHQFPSDGARARVVFGEILWVTVSVGLRLRRRGEHVPGCKCVVMYFGVDLPWKRCPSCWKSNS